ncbi:MAG: hypothetical protein KIS61_11370 [Candidatus Eremiobacteraeota bacterium]|nr:hypothetical protein [Candidatus Eremiobacteraeota bacterium]
MQHIPRARQHQVTYAGHFANALILRSWAVDPELRPGCHKEMKRDFTLQAPLAPPPALGQDLLDESQFSDCESQVPAGWDDWEAA